MTSPSCQLCGDVRPPLAVAVVGILYHGRTRVVGVPVCQAHLDRLRLTEPAYRWWAARLGA